MGDLWLRVKLWTKGIFFSLLLIYVLVFVANNSSTHVVLWVWFRKNPETSVLLLVLYAFLTGVVVTLLTWTTLTTLRQVSDLRHRSRTGKLEREMADMRAKAAMLRAKGVPAVAPQEMASANPNPEIRVTKPE